MVLGVLVQDSPWLRENEKPEEAGRVEEEEKVPGVFMEELDSYEAGEPEGLPPPLEIPPHLRFPDYADLIPDDEYDDIKSQASDSEAETDDDLDSDVEVDDQPLPLEDVNIDVEAPVQEIQPVLLVAEPNDPPAFANDLLALGLWEMAAQEWIQPNIEDRLLEVVNDDLNNHQVVPANGGDEVTSVIEMGPHPQFPTKDVLIFFQMKVGNELTPILTRVANFFRRHIPFTTIGANMMVNDVEGIIPEFLHLTDSNAGRVSWWWAKTGVATDITPNNGHYTSFVDLYPSCQSGVVYSDMLESALREPELYTTLCIDQKGKVMKSISLRVQSWVARNDYLVRDIGIVMTTTLCIVNQLVARSILFCGVLPTSTELDFRTKGVACPTRARLELHT